MIATGRPNRWAQPSSPKRTLVSNIKLRAVGALIRQDL
jgi:hypothetical protein